MTKEDMRRLGILRVSVDILPEFFKDGMLKVSQGMPEDAAVVGVEYESKSHMLTFVLRSKEFPKHAEGAMILERDAPCFERVTPTQEDKIVIDGDHVGYEVLSEL